MAGKAGRSGRPTKSIEAQRLDIAVRCLGTPANQKRLWLALLASDSDKIKLDALQYLTDRAYGKAMQPVGGRDGGAIPIAITILAEDGDL